MKLGPVLSIRQPWVDLIMSGEKPTEIRSQRRKHVGELWIHSSRWEPGIDRDEWDCGDGLTGCIVGKVVQLGSIRGSALRMWIAGEREHFEQIEIERLEYIEQSLRQMSPSTDGEPLDPWHYAGLDDDDWNLLLVAPQLLATPIPCGGQLGYFHPEIPDGTDLTIINPVAIV